MRENFALGRLPEPSSLAHLGLLADIFMCGLAQIIG